MAAETLARDPVVNNNMKHVARRHYYAREMQTAGEVKVSWIDTKLNVADALTKALPVARFEVWSREAKACKQHHERM